MTGGPHQLFPALDPATELALRESIRRFGVLVPVVRDQHGQIIDGHHRTRIAGEESVTFRVDVVNCTDDQEAREIAATLNADRRQMDAGQRREIVAALREAGHSLRAIAGAVGTDKKQVQRDLAKVGTVSPPETVRGSDGKQYPARRPTVVAAKNERDAEKAQDLLASVEEPPAGVRSVRDLGRQKRVEERAAIEAAENSAPTIPASDVDLRTVAVADLNIDEPVDAIITDPPYPREYLDVYTDLARFAATNLKAGGSLVCMAGQSYLPDVLARLSEHLDYQWTLAYLTPGGQATQLWARKVNTFWKPLLWFTNGDYAGPWIGDVARSEVNDNDKRHHHWGQSESGMADIVRRFTEPGELIVDPFVGGGTTGVVAVDLARRFIGADRDRACVDSTRRRIADRQEQAA